MPNSLNLFANINIKKSKKCKENRFNLIIYRMDDDDTAIKNSNI